MKNYPEAQCPHIASCPGCPRFGLGGISREHAARLGELIDLANVERYQVRDGSPYGYRHRARLAIRGRSNSPKIGIFEEGSHKIVDIPNCPVHHPMINETAAVMKRVIREHALAPYADKPHVGLLRYIQIVVERATRRVQVVWITNSETADPVRTAMAAFTAAMGDRLHSLFWNGQPDRANAILGPHWEKISGPDAIAESMDGAAIHYPPGAFGQSNLPMAEEIVRLVRSYVPDRARVIEYHAGVGAIGLGLLARSESVTFNEISPDGISGLEMSLKDHPHAQKATILRGPAGRFGNAMGDADMAIFDPPRKGLEPELLSRLHDRPPRRVAIVACGFREFIRDAAVLIRGHLKLTELTAFTLFPFTDHVEIVACFDR